jgi:hypothetical protein
LDLKFCKNFVFFPKWALWMRHQIITLKLSRVVTTFSVKLNLADWSPNTLRFSATGV